MNTYLIIAIAAVAAAGIAALITYLIMHAHEVKACNNLENQLIASQEALKAAEAIRQAEGSAHEKALQLQQEGFDCRHMAGGWRLYSSVMKDAQAAKQAAPCGME